VTAAPPIRRAPRRPRPAAGAGGDASPARLWAPWRARWLAEATRSRGCLFCRVARARADEADLVLARRPHALLMLNRYPYTSGHVMAAVRRHAARVHELTAAERADLLDLVALAERALAAELAPDGVNYGANVGRVAGAGFPGHLHVHLVPRWDGDTNFMPVVAATRVLPESLDVTWSRLRRAIAKLEPPAAARGSASGVGGGPGGSGGSRRPRQGRGRGQG